MSTRSRIRALERSNRAGVGKPYKVIHCFDKPEHEVAEEVAAAELAGFNTICIRPVTPKNSPISER